MSFKRFVATHGAVDKIITDSASTFVKADKLLRVIWANLRDARAQAYSGQQAIKWSLNQPRSGITVNLGRKRLPW